MVTLKSHGFKYARPEANLVFDVSYFKNPWRDEKIRNEKDHKTRRRLILESMQFQTGMIGFIKLTTQLLMKYDSMFPDENIQVAFCCSAGEYRSPAIVEMVAKEMERLGAKVQIIHNPNSKI